MGGFYHKSVCMPTSLIKVHIRKVKKPPKNLPRRIFKDRRDMGRGCIFSDPPHTLFVF